MKSRIAKLYNVLVIGGAMAASASCTKADNATDKAAAAPAQAKPADNAPAPTPAPPANDQPTPTEKAPVEKVEPTPAATTDPAAPATADDKKKTVKKGDKSADKAKGGGVKGWS